MFTEAAERLLNRNLPRSPRARTLCGELAGRSVALTIEGLALRFVLGSNGDRLSLGRETSPSHDPASADAEFRGTPLNLLALAGPDAEGVIRRGDVRVEGDAEAAQRFEDLLAAAFEKGLIADAAVAASVEQARTLWHLRESIPLAQGLEGLNIKHDISVPISRIPAFVRATDEALARAIPGVRLVDFGHLGDGNLHYNVQAP